jgi:hypothetical protein
MPSPKWTFKSRFRAGAYQWNGTALASKRLKEAVSEIKKAAKSDPALAGEGVIDLFSRLWPALEHIDSSSGALGTAVYHAVEELIPILINAPWDIFTRQKLLEQLFEAILDDGVSYLAPVEEQWGKICVYPELAKIWADRLIVTLRECLRKPGWLTGTAACFSCLLETNRYGEIRELVSIAHQASWSIEKYWAKALAQQGKIDEAIACAEKYRGDKWTTDPTINKFCEQVLLENGRVEDAYKRYALNVPEYGTYLNFYRALVKKYPTMDKKQILSDLMNKDTRKGKWFASARHAGFLDLALECAKDRESEPKALLNAVDDLADSNPEYAIEFTVEAIRGMLTGTFYEHVQPIHVTAAFVKMVRIARKHNLCDLLNKLFNEMLKQNWAISDKRLRDVMMANIENMSKKPE